MSKKVTILLIRAKKGSRGVKLIKNRWNKLRDWVSKDNIYPQ